MSIYNINSIQNKLDLLNSSYTDEYILQSLANLGQRLSVKGDSITTNTFRFNELFTSIKNLDESQYIGTVHYDINNSCILFSVINRENFIPIESVTIANKNNELIIDNLIMEEIQVVNNVNNYSDLIIKSTNFTHFIKLSATYKGSEYINEIFVYDVNKYTNTLLEGLKIFNYTILGVNKLLLYHIVYDSVTSNYKLDFYISNSNIDLYEINELIKSINVNNVHDVFDALCNGLKNNFDYINADLNTDIVINYNNRIFSIKNNMIAIVESLGINNIKTNIEYLNSDINILYPYLKTLFSEKIYLESNDSFKKQLIYELYNTIISYSNIQLTNQNNIVYIPINFAFEYYCNSNNIFEIYGNVNDITVKYIYDNINVATLDDFYTPGAILCNTNNYTKTSTFNYLIEYDNTINSTVKIINNIHIIKKYILAQALLFDIIIPNDKI
jgi:hypothetical protein